MTQELSIKDPLYGLENIRNIEQAEDFIESLLKQSFIKYFQSEVERWIKVFDYHCDMSDERHLTMRNVARTEIENLEAQIKELEK